MKLLKNEREVISGIKCGNQKQKYIEGRNATDKMRNEDKIQGEIETWNGKNRGEKERDEEVDEQPSRRIFFIKMGRIIFT